jgi:hypothetical protein
MIFCLVFIGGMAGDLRTPLLNSKIIKNIFQTFDLQESEWWWARRTSTSQVGL